MGYIVRGKNLVLNLKKGKNGVEKNNLVPKVGKKEGFGELLVVVLDLYCTQFQEMCCKYCASGL